MNQSIAEIAALPRPSLHFKHMRADRGAAELKKVLLTQLREAESDRDHLCIQACGSYPVEGSVDRLNQTESKIMKIVEQLSKICK